MVRGVRPLTDIAGEFTMLMANRQLDRDIETVFPDGGRRLRTRLQLADQANRPAQQRCNAISICARSHHRATPRQDAGTIQYLEIAKWIHGNQRCPSRKTQSKPGSTDCRNPKPVRFARKIPALKSSSRGGRVRHFGLLKVFLGST